jgi:hypothetical protein
MAGEPSYQRARDNRRYSSRRNSCRALVHLDARHRVNLIPLFVILFLHKRPGNRDVCADCSIGPSSLADTHARVVGSVLCNLPLQKREQIPAGLGDN